LNWGGGVSKFNIGDVIKVIDVAQSYTTYFEWAEQHNLNQYSLDSLPFKGEEGIIVTKGYHDNNVDFLYGIEINGRHYILSEKGLDIACNNPATTLEAVLHLQSMLEYVGDTKIIITEQEMFVESLGKTFVCENVEVLEEVCKAVNYLSKQETT
jgi:hypothetical protein